MADIEAIQRHEVKLDEVGGGKNGRDEVTVFV
jgi:hypothetical protein